MRNLKIKAKILNRVVTEVEIVHLEVQAVRTMVKECPEEFEVSSELQSFGTRLWALRK